MRARFDPEVHPAKLLVVARDIRQCDVANAAGLHIATLTRILNGYQSMPLDVGRRLAAFLDVPVWVTRGDEIEVLARHARTGREFVLQHAADRSA